MSVESTAAPFGLDERPVNSTCLAFDRPNPDATVDFQQVFPFLPISDVVVLTQPPGDSSFWYFATRGGIVGRFVNTPNVSNWSVVLNLSSRVTVPADGGLIQLLFHRNYPTDPRVFVNYSVDGTYGEPNDIIVSSFETSDGGVTLDPSSEIVLMTQPRGTFHQGGFMAFGADGLLYFGIGDGASQTDPDNNAQTVTDLRGNIFRIDVDNVPGGELYGIPPDNPYAGNPRCGPTGNNLPCPEIFAFGFRNPFRGDIDLISEVIWIADVGFNQREEVNTVLMGGNYGWNVYEGTLCREYSGSCADTSLIGPVVDYSHADGKCAVIGGYTYRGNSIAELEGRYLFADHCTSKVSAVQYDAGGNPFEEILLPGGSGIGRINTFARDNAGELYVVTGSEIYKIVDNDPGGGPPTAPALLSQTGCFDSADPKIPTPGLIPYDLNSALWSDGAAKRRWVALRDGTTVDIDVDGDFLFPPGTVLIKEFSYSGVPHETRLFVHHLDGIWAGYSYEWREDGSNADLLPAGKVKILPSGHTWTYPSRAECLRCHTDSANFSLGLELGQLNRELLYPQTMRIANQLQTLDHIGVFTSGLPADIDDLPAYAELDQAHHNVHYRARSYLHSNCSGCHRPGEITQAPMDFLFSTDTADLNACNVTPVFGDLGVPGAKILSPGNPDLSVLKLRDESRDALVQMPPLATAIAHSEWVTLVDNWISDSTICDPDVDSDSDGVPDTWDNCPAFSNASQRDTDRNGIGDACEATANAGVDQFVVDTDEDGTEQVDLDGSGSTSPNPSDLIDTWTWREGGEVIASGETASVNLPIGVHTIQLEIETVAGYTDIDTVIVTVQAGVSNNIAPLATVAASSENIGTAQQAVKAVDEVIDGWPGDYTREWATLGQRAGAWIELNWGGTSYLVDRVVFHDRLNSNDHILAGTIDFSDGSTMTIGSLPNLGSAMEVSFTPRPLTSLRFTVDSVAATSRNIGLAEIAVYGVPAGNLPPVANAGADLVVAESVTVQLDGSASSDPDGDPLNYQWTQTGGQPVVLSDDTAVSPSFNAPSGLVANEVLIFDLVVNDGEFDSAPDTVIVTVQASNPVATNIAPLAAVAASSQNISTAQQAVKAVDEVVDGWPGDYTREWATTGEKAGAWIELNWAGTSYLLNRVVLHDRPNSNDHILGGRIDFSDGSTVAVGSPPNDGSAMEVSFTPRLVTSLRFTVESVGATTINIGLSEIEAHGTPNP